MLKLGTADVSIRLGSTTINKIMLGATTIYEGIPSATLTVGMGQSNMEHWSADMLTYGNKAGELAFEAGMREADNFINGATSGSFLLRSSWLAAGNTPGIPADNHYWVDDTVDPWVVGQRFLDMEADIAVESKTIADIDFVIWSQGESDGAQIGAGNQTVEAYKAGMEWLVDHLYENCPKLRKFHIRPIGKLINDPSEKIGYMRVRQVQQEMADEYSAQVVYGSETYDCQMRFENDAANDTVHRSGNGHATEATRAAFEVKKVLGLYDGGTRGPTLGSVAINDSGNIVVTIAHDAGTNIGKLTTPDTTTSYACTYYTGSPIDISPRSGQKNIFKLFDAQGVEVPLTSVFITGTNQITITPSAVLATTGNTLYYGYGSYATVDRGCYVLDNAAGNILPMKTWQVTVDGSIDPYLEREDLVSFFDPASMYNAAGSASDAVVWTKRAGYAGSARKDDAKAAPVWYADSNMGLSLPGFYFDPASGRKLLVDCDLTSSSNYTLFVVATPGDVSADTGTNALITTGNTSNSNNNLFMFVQPVGSSGILNLGSAGQLFTSDIVHINTTGLYGMRRNGSTLREYVETGVGNQPDKTIGAVTPVVDSDGGPIYSIGNATGHPNTDALACFKGAVHYVVLFNTALNDAEANQVRLYLAQVCDLL